MLIIKRQITVFIFDYTNIMATAVLRLRREILSGIVLALCVTGAFAISNNIFNIYVMIFFGIVGYFFNKYKIPQSPLILSAILGLCNSAYAATIKAPAKTTS